MTPTPVQAMARGRAVQVRAILCAGLLAGLVVPIALFVMGEPVVGALAVPVRVGLAATAGLVGGLSAYSVLRWCPRGRRSGLVGAALVLLLGGFALRSILPLERQSMTGAELAARPSALLITVDVAPPADRDFPAERWVVLEDVYAASPVRDPALASVLTGRPVHFHQCWFDGSAPRRGALTIGQTLARLGFDTRVFDAGDLPDWCAEDLTRERGGLSAAVEWIAGRGNVPRFAHVHLGNFDAVAIDRTVAALDAGRVEVFVVSLVGTLGLDDSARFLRDEDVDVLVAWRAAGTAGEPLPRRPRSAATVAPTLLARLDVPAVDAARSQPLVPAIDGVAMEPGEVVVSIGHRADGRPHRVLVHFDGGALAIEATPLSDDSPDDWNAIGLSAEHVAYRNALRGLPAGPERDDVLLRLEHWRQSSAWIDPP